METEYPGYLECDICPKYKMDDYGAKYELDGLSLYTVFFRNESVAQKYLKAHINKVHRQR
jgi:hypothetical protein